MSFNYNPEDKVDGGKAEGGQYPFSVDDIEEKTFRSGNPGWKVILQVAAFQDRDIKVYTNLVNVGSALWKFEQFCFAFGLDFNNPPPGGWDHRQFIGKTGKAEFELGTNGYLEVTEFLAVSANDGPDSQQPPPLTDDDNIPI